MANVYASKIINWRFMPHFLLISLQIGYSFFYLITEAAFNHGLNPHVAVTYRYLVAGFFMFPFAYFLERKSRPKLTFALFLEIFMLALVGASLSQNMYYASLRYTSSTFVTSMVNTIPSITFVMAILLRLERVDIKKLRGIAKIVGTLISLVGALIIGLYKGHVFQSLESAPFHIRSDSFKKTWVIGTILLVASSITWSMWYIFQAYTIRRYPAKLSLTALINFLGGIQSAVFTVFILPKPAAWIISFDVKFWSIVYGGVICSAAAICIQLWCTKQKGPVFVTVFTPLVSITVAILAYFLVGEELRTGSVLGGAIAIIGLYILLWGKEGDGDQNKQSKQSSLTSDEETMTQSSQIAGHHGSLIGRVESLSLKSSPSIRAARGVSPSLERNQLG